MKKKIIQITSKILLKIGGNYLRHSPTMYKFADKIVKKMATSNEVFEIQGFRMKRGKTTRLMILTGEHEPATTDLIKSIVKPGMSVFDLGANIGWFTLILSKLVGINGHVYAFEPVPYLFEILKENIQLNGLQNVSIFPLALSNKTGVGKLTLNSFQDGDNRLGSESIKSNSIDVEITTIDAFCKKHNTKIDFLKMDIQGSEPKALEGMMTTILQNPQIKIVTEFWLPAIIDLGSSPKDFLDSLENLGFSINEIEGNKSYKLTPIKKEKLLETQTDVNLFCYRP